MLAASLAAVLAACGGGGGGSDDGGGGGGGGGGGSTVTTWGSTTLPGHLIVNSSTGNARIYDLGDGTHRDLPESASADDDRWVASADGSILVRWNDAGSTTATVDFFDVDTLDEVLDAVQIEKDIGTPMLGFDTSLLMAFWEPDGYENALSVFDIDALSVVSENSELDGETIINNPAGWLSDTTYVYLYQNQLVRATPGAGDDTVIATLDLPYNNASADDYLSGYSDLVVSRDGTRVAFTWGEERNNDRDYHVWVADIDGGNLHRLTAVASASDPLVYNFTSPTWSPDGQYVAFVLSMDGASASPVYPDAPFGGSRVVGTTGCGGSQVIVVDADEEDVAATFPDYDATHGVKVAADSGSEGRWLSSCSSVSWAD